jgi:glycosyltransferase involved in cell wall biosynthesis
MITTYNRATYLERALASVLSQDPGPDQMQIEVVDDASTVDDPEPVVRRVGGDRVSFFRQPRNLGLFANANSCIERSRGEWVHLVDSDDVVLSGYYERLGAVLRGRDDIGAAFCRSVALDENDRWVETPELERTAPGIMADFMEKLGPSQTIRGTAMVVRRKVFEILGGFRLDLAASDWEMWIRIAARFPVWFQPEILAGWRIHPHTVTSGLVRSGENIAGARQWIAIRHPLLPPERADAVSREAKDWLAEVAFQTVRDAIEEREFTMALNQFREGLKCGVSPFWINALLLLPAQITADAVRRAYAASRRCFSRRPS